MEENIKKKIIEIIRTSINEVVYDEMKQWPEKLEARQQELKMTKAQRAEAAHNALFGGEGEQANFKNKLKLHESEERPKVSPQEIDNFEKELKASLSKFSVNFVKTNIGGKERLISFPVKNGKTDAIILGTISNLGSNKELQFSISLLNGFQIATKEIKMDDEETKKFIDTMTNLYNNTLKEKLSSFLNPNKNAEQAAIPPAGGDIGAVPPPAAPPTV